MSKLLTVTLGMLMATTNAITIQHASAIQSKLQNQLADGDDLCHPEGIRRIIFEDTECKTIDHDAMKDGFEIREHRKRFYDGTCQARNREVDGGEISMIIKCTPDLINIKKWKGHDGCDGDPKVEYEYHWGVCESYGRGKQSVIYIKDF